MKKLTRRDFIKTSTLAGTMLAAGISPPPACAKAKSNRVKSNKKVIVIGFDGMDPRLCEKLMSQGKLPNLDRLRQQNGYRVLETSNPPQSPVAWANFINGAGPGSHGIFDFIHRDPERQAYPFFAAAETLPGLGYTELGDYKIQLDFWPFNHKPPKTVLKRQGVPFWDYLDAAGIESIFYNLPSNYPPSPSQYGNHRCLAGMGTPDLLGTYGTYQYFAEDLPEESLSEGGGKRRRITLENETSRPLGLMGPTNTMLKEAKPAEIPFVIHRDRQAQAAVIEIQSRTIILKKGEWSSWISLEFKLSTPAIMPDKSLKGICRLYLQEVTPHLKLYVTPVNADPSAPAIKITEPPDFSGKIAGSLGFFYTTGFQEDHKALSNKVFTDDEFVAQAEYVLRERINLFTYALQNYDDGLLFFYFSSTDMQAHMLWWDTDEKHPYRSAAEAKKYFEHLQGLYSRMDAVAGDCIQRYGNDAHIIIMSDHGFANFKRQFNLNTWLRDNGYLGPADCTSLLEDVDWSKTRAFGLGVNSLYVNLKGRERFGIVEQGMEQEKLLAELIEKLEAVRDANGKKVIRKVYRAGKEYSGPALRYAPDLIIGYSRDYRASWKTCLGDITKDVLLDNDSAWAADHCMDAYEIPGVLFSNRPVTSSHASLVDLAPSILTEFGLQIPKTMTGRNIF